MNSSKLEQLKIEREPEKPDSSSRWPVYLVAICLLLIAAGVYWVYFRPEAAFEVRVAIAREISNQAASTVLNASGYVTARRRATVSSKFTGKVTEVLIEEGMEVETGQVLARLDSSNISKSFALAEAQLVAARTSRKETEALLVEARAIFKRTESLLERGLASDAEMDRARAALQSLRARLERNEADVQVAEKQLDVYRQQLEDTIVRAPFAGVIVAKNAQPGEMISPVSAGGGFTRTGIGTIVDMSSLEIEIDVNEAYINRVKPGQKIVATLDAYPDWSIPCQVIAIIPTADRQRATVEVRVGFDQQDSRILPDMGVKVAFQDPGGQNATARGAVVIPNSAVTESEGRWYAWVVRNGLAERRAVSVEGERGKDMLISSGLEAGDKVILNKPAEIINGSRVKGGNE